MKVSKTETLTIQDGCCDEMTEALQSAIDASDGSPKFIDDEGSLFVSMFKGDRKRFIFCPYCGEHIAYPTGTKRLGDKKPGVYDNVYRVWKTGVGTRLSYLTSGGWYWLNSHIFFADAKDSDRWIAAS